MVKIVNKICDLCKSKKLGEFKLNEKGICPNCGADYLVLADVFSIPARKGGN